MSGVFQMDCMKEASESEVLLPHSAHFVCKHRADCEPEPKAATAHTLRKLPLHLQRGSAAGSPAVIWLIR